MTKVIYIRTSTEEQNPKLQIKDCESLAGKDYLLIQDKQSAWQDFKERQNFKELQNLIKRKKVTDIYVWDLDRIYRNRKKLLEFFEYCKVFNCNIHSFRQQWLDDLLNIPKPFDEMMHNFMLQIMGWIAEEESTKKSERVKNAVVKKDGEPTKSYKGNKWGRKSYSKQTINRVLELHKLGKSLRQIQNEVTYYDNCRNLKKISLGGVHKIVSENP